MVSRCKNLVVSWFLDILEIGKSDKTNCIRYKIDFEIALAKNQKHFNLQNKY